MLGAIGVGSVDDLFAPISAAIRARADFEHVPPALDDIALRRHLQQLAGKNAHADSHPCFLGAGVYDRYSPPVVAQVMGRSEFYTAYTPYQPEVSQGNLQSIYEFQTLISRLFGMDVANASLYDGATALAEAVIMACDLTKRKQVVLAGSVHPAFRRTVATYLPLLNDAIVEVGHDGASGQFSLDVLGEAVSSDTACVVVQQPNFFGVVEDLRAVADAAHARGALLIVVVEPVSVGVLESPGACGADIVVGEGQSLGLPMGFGGPLLGLFACRKEHVRRIPGRIVGGTVDAEGTRAYTMTLRTREQDIRRDQATSNICTNQALWALGATVYLSLMGKQGLRQAAELSLQNAHYAWAQITALPGYEPVFSGPFFQEFVVRCPEDPVVLNKRLFDNHGIIGGLPLTMYDGLNDCLLFCVTEMRTKNEIDALVTALEGA